MVFLTAGYFRALSDISPALMLIVDERYNIEYFNPAVEQSSGYTPNELNHMNALDLVSPDSQLLFNLFDSRREKSFEVTALAKNKQKFRVKLTTRHLDDKILISGYKCEKKLKYTNNKANNTISHLDNKSCHDFLTGFYNCTALQNIFQKKDIQAPLGMILLDIDGLKIINETYGFEAGNQILAKMAELLKDICPPDGFPIRSGGDEFCLVIPGYTEQKLEELAREIYRRMTFLHGQDINIGVSLGYALKTARESMEELYYKANKHLHKEKYLKNGSSYSAIVDISMRALEARDRITSNHCRRVQQNVVQFARKIGVDEVRINNLSLFAYFHDIGKVGIPDRILLKRESLTWEEQRIMRQHSSIGYRIVSKSPISHIADWILKHHEWWNGQGYPLGIKGRDIPFECRLLALADAYDAMSIDRPYRKALSRSEIKQEFAKNSGIQFDPDLTEAFLDYISLD